MVEGKEGCGTRIGGLTDITLIYYVNWPPGVSVGVWPQRLNVLSDAHGRYLYP